MRAKAGALCALSLAAALLVGFAGASAPAATTATPPTLKIEVIGKGKVTGLGLNCGLGALSCYSAYGSASPSVTLTTTAAAGWTFSGWDPAGCASPCNVVADETAIAVFVTSPAAAVQTSTFGVSLGSPANGAVTNDGAPNYPIDCSPPTTTDCSLTAVQGSTITVVEAPATGGYFFAGWGGACSGTGVSCSVYLTADKFVGANFVATTPNKLTVTVSGNGTVTGGGIACGAGATCDAQEPPNATVTLTATPQSGYAFVDWGPDGCTGSQSTCTVQMDAALVTVEATFAQLLPLSLSVSGAGTVSGGGITCGPGPQTCTGSETPDSTITFTATPTTAGGSVSWSGCTSTAGAICSVTLGTNAVSVTATFAGGTAPPVATNSLQIKVQGDGYVTGTTGNTSIHCTAAGGNGCTVNVQANTSLTLSAVPASGSTGDFLHWANDCASFTTTFCSLTMTGPKNVEADFAGGNQTYVLSGQVVGSGTITGAGLNCTAAGGSGCNVQQAASATALLAASPAAGATFTGWSGACSGTSPACTLSMTTTKVVTATFTAGGGGGATQDLSIAVSGAGSVTDSRGVCTSTAGKSRSCTQAFSQGDAVTLSAKAAPGFVFTGWTGACSGAKTTCGITMTTAQRVGATFERPHLAPTRAPTVVKTAAGYRVTLSFSTREPGTLKLAVKRGATTVGSSSAKVAAGNRKISFTVKRTGRYVFTVTVVAKAGTHSIHWGVLVR